MGDDQRDFTDILCPLAVISTPKFKTCMILDSTRAKQGQNIGLVENILKERMRGEESQ